MSSSNVGGLLNVVAKVLFWCFVLLFLLLGTFFPPRDEQWSVAGCEGSFDGVVDRASTELGTCAER
jgi:hypothetical protein